MEVRKVKIEADFMGEGFQGNYLFRNVTGDIVRDHLWLNMERSGFPGQDIPHGTRVRFYCTMFGRGRKPARYTDIREVQVI